MRANEVRISVSPDLSVSGLLLVPDQPFLCFVMAHGAGAGMRHPFMQAVAEGLADLGAATLRYQFPYMEQGSKRPNRPALAHSTVRAAVGAATRLTPGLPVFAGGKSFGGRMTSEAQAATPLPGARGLVFFGFPLHPPGKPSTRRADHLASVVIPMLFLQGTRDALADMALLKQTLARLRWATLNILEGADHSFHVPVNSGRTDRNVLQQALGALITWARAIPS